MTKTKCSRFFWGFLKKKKALLSVYLILSAWVGLFGVFNTWLLREFVDSVLNLKGALSGFSLPLFLLLANSELHNLSWRGINLLCLKLIPETKSEITETLFKRVHTKPYSFFQERLSGSIAQDIGIVTDAFERAVGSIGIRLIRGASQLVVSLILMWQIYFGYTLLFLGWTLCFGTLSFLVSKKVRFYSRETARTQSEILGQVVDSFSGAKEVKLFGKAKDESLRLGFFLNNWRDAYKEKSKFFLKLSFVQGLSITCLLLGMSVLLTRQVAVGTLSIGDLVYILSATFFLTETIWANTELVDQFNEQMGRVAQSLFHLLDRDAKPSTVNHESVAIKKGEICFESVTFSYQSAHPLFEGFSLRISSGEKIGIVGRSGMGKSTLLHLLLGLYPLQSGRILIDNQDIALISPESLYRAISVVSQNPSLFQRSVLDNIKFSQGMASNKDVLHAAQLAGLGSQPEMNFNASLLSGGERQRVAIARAILKDAPILILDEPTSQLDALTESEIKESLYFLMEGKTTLVVSHDLPMLSKMDRIIVFERGKVIEEGTHLSLLKEGGHYAALWSAQFL